MTITDSDVNATLSLANTTNHLRDESGQLTETINDETISTNNQNALKFKQFKEGKSTKHKKEADFWKDLVRNQLSPLIQSEKKKQELNHGLQELRNKSVFAFFIVNLIVIVMVLGLKLVQLSVEITCPGKEPTEIDPIGLSFIVVFGVILSLQLLGMLVHRMYTVVQLISTATLCLPTVLEKDENGKKKRRVKRTDEQILKEFKEKLMKE